MPFARSITTLVSALALGVLSAAAPAGAATIKVLTYNTYHGGQKTGTTDGQLDTIAAQKPDVVVLQEATADQLSYYVNGLNARLGTSAWHGKYTMHCKTGTKPNCTYYSGESVMILTRLTTVSSSATLIWAKDDYWVAKAVLQMQVTAADGTTFHVFAVHTPALADAAAARITYVNDFTAWAGNFSGTRLVGGDFNAHPGTTPITMMQQSYKENWAVAGSGMGYTHDAANPTTRLDYWFSSGSAAVSSIAVIADAVNSDHRPVSATFNVSGGSTPAPAPTPTPTTGETTLMSDAFGSLNQSNWPGGVFTGSQDTTIKLTPGSTGMQIGALKSSTSGSHYNGFSSNPYDLSSNGSASVQLVTAPNTATTAYAMFSVGSDANNYYRWYESGNALVAEKRIGGTKTTLVNLPYSASSHQFLRIRREYNSSTGANEVVFETAPNSSGAPGTWTVRFRETWNGSVNAAAMKFELKAGTSESVISPGSACWDNFKAATNSK
jgi:endonuclease/exonuclease/phosphatase family metal-dependent hydrolase